MCCAGNEYKYKGHDEKHIQSNLVCKLFVLQIHFVHEEDRGTDKTHYTIYINICTYTLYRQAHIETDKKSNNRNEHRKRCSLPENHHRFSPFTLYFTQNYPSNTGPTAIKSLRASVSSHPTLSTSASLRTDILSEDTAQSGLQQESTRHKAHSRAQPTRGRGESTLITHTHCCPGCPSY